MRNSRGERFTENTVVRLHECTGEKSKERKLTARIIGFAGVPGGVMLDRPLAKFRCWNIDDLTLVRKEDKDE